MAVVTVVTAVVVSVVLVWRPSSDPCVCVKGDLAKVCGGYF